MIKVLVANENLEQNTHCCQFLANDKDFKIISTYTGLSTLETYFEIEPNILILDSFFKDIKYTDILDKISMFPKDANYPNTIVTANNDSEKLLLENTSNVYRVFSKPLDFNKLSNTLNIMKNEIKYVELTKSEIDHLLLQLNFHLGSNRN